MNESCYDETAELKAKLAAVTKERDELQKIILDAEIEVRRCADWYKDSSMAAIADDLAAALQPANGGE